MKKIYLLTLISLIILACIFVYKIIFTPIGDNSRLGNGIQSFGVFVALFAAIIALSAADPEKLSVKFEIETCYRKDDVAEYDKGKLSSGMKKFYEGFPDPFKSYKVNFKIINTSGLYFPSFSFIYIF
jgi:hypothetical protein